jgi:hypothetical protein
MIIATFYRPFAVLAKAALLGDMRKCFSNVVVENGRGAVILRGKLPDAQLACQAVSLAARATGAIVINHIQVAS